MDDPILLLLVALANVLVGNLAVGLLFFLLFGWVAIQESRR